VSVTKFHTQKNYRQILFYVRDTVLKKSCKSKLGKSNEELPFNTVYFLRVRGLKASSYIVYDCTTKGYTDLYSLYVLYIQYT